METAQSRVARAALMISESSLAANLPGYHKESLAAVAAGGETQQYISIEFRSTEAKTSINLYVSADSEGFETDEKGDSYYVQRVNTSTSWPTHGSASPELNSLRLGFMTQVNDLAARVDAAVGGEVRTLHRTAAEIAEAIAERARKAAEARQQRIAHAVVVAVCKSMRVGSERNVPLQLAEELKGTAGEGKVWHVTTEANKTYVLKVYTYTATVVRTA